MKADEFEAKMKTLEETIAKLETREKKSAQTIKKLETRITRAEDIEAIKKFGPSPIHRMTFEPVKSLVNKA